MFTDEKRGLLKPGSGAGRSASHRKRTWVISKNPAREDRRKKIPGRDRPKTAEPMNRRHFSKMRQAAEQIPDE